MTFWNRRIEEQFFKDVLKIVPPDKLFYLLEDGYYAYIPKDHHEKGVSTLQSRNSYIGQFTEKWCQTLFTPIARSMGLYAVHSAVCEEIGLTRQSSADLAFCTKDTIAQRAEDIKLLFEIKMSITANYRFSKQRKLEYIGDYTTHKGTPSLLRSDSMLKAIGKSINIRVSGTQSTKIPIIILGNSPISNNYISKVDYLKQCGIIQQFISLNPHPTDTDFLHDTPKKGFITITSEEQLVQQLKSLIDLDLRFFSSMIDKPTLGAFIRIANQEETDIAKAEKFLSLIHP